MIKRIINLFFYILIINTVSLPQGGGLIIGNNFRIFPGNTSQTEVFITKHPTNTNILFGSANTIQFQPTFFLVKVFMYPLMEDKIGSAVILAKELISFFMAVIHQLLLIRMGLLF